MSVADDCMATCGTINLDYRSLYHHLKTAVYGRLSGSCGNKNDLIRTLENVVM